MNTFNYFQSLDIILAEVMGCTESSGPQTTNMTGPLCIPGSVGQAYKGINNQILNPNEEGIGELVTSSRNVFMGYNKEETKTKESFENDWFKSGDLGRIDGNGFLWLLGTYHFF